VIVTSVPTGPVAGDIPVMVGDWALAVLPNKTISASTVIRIAPHLFQFIAASG
jgi:hypothetical protein